MNPHPLPPPIPFGRNVGVGVDSKVFVGHFSTFKTKTKHVIVKHDQVQFHCYLNFKAAVVLVVLTSCTKILFGCFINTYHYVQSKPF